MILFDIAIVIGKILIAAWGIFLGYFLTNILLGWIVRPKGSGQ
jgi:hypothetical protein